MKIQNIILIFIVLLIINPLSISAQQKITIVEDIKTTYELPQMQWQYRKTHKTSRDKAKYVTKSRLRFRVGDKEELLSLGENGEQLRFYLRDSEAEALLEKAFKQKKKIPITGASASLGTIAAGVGYATRRVKNSDQESSGFFRSISGMPMFYTGATITVGSYIALLVLNRNSKKNIYKSVDIHNNSITSSMDTNKIRLDGLGIQWDNQSSRPQLSLSWVF